jgi:hypothetical protein
MTEINSRFSNGSSPSMATFFGSLKNPNWKDEIPLDKLTVQDHQAKGLVLYGLDGNGAAVGIRLWARRHFESDS